MVGVAVVLVLVLLWLLTSDRTSPLSPSPDDRSVLEAIRLAFYAVAGIGGVVALTVAYRRQRLHEAADEREDTKLYNERFAAAAEQLASEQAANRLAGVYAMAALADDWDAGRQTCVDVLCAYVRMPYEPPPHRAERDAAEPGRFQSVIEERLVRHTVTDVIGEHLRAEPVEGRTWHWCDFNFNGATLDDGDFRNARFLGFASFAYARFPRSMVNFTGAVFAGPFNFRRATIDGGDVVFDSAEFHRNSTFAEMTVSDGGLFFRSAKFLGPTWFDGTKFIGGRVEFKIVPNDPAGETDAFGPSIGFADACFSGAEVSFDGTALGSEYLDFTKVEDWSRPPRLDVSVYGDGRVLLPESDAREQEREPSHTED